MNETASIDALVKDLSSQDWPVRSQAVTALAAIGEAAVPALLVALSNDDRNDELRVFENTHIRQALQAIGEPAFLALSGAFLHSAQTGAVAAKTLADYFAGPRAVPPLIAALGNPALGSRVRSYTAEALGKLKDLRAVDPLLVALTDSDDFVRANAATALAEHRDPRVINPLLAALRLPSTHPISDVHQALASALKRLGANATEVFVIALRDANPRVRAGAVAGLSASTNARALDFLLQAVVDPDESVRRNAAEALAAFNNPRAIEPLLQALRLGYTEREITDMRLAQALKSIGAPAVGPLIMALRENNAYLQRGVTLALGGLGDVRAIEPLLEILNHAEPNVRSAVAEALGLLHADRAVESLTARLNDSETKVRMAAAQALGRLGDARATEALLPALLDVKDDVRRRAAWALGQIKDPRALQPLISALADESIWVQAEVATALGGSGDPQAIEPLIACFNSAQYDNVKLPARKALGQLGYDINQHPRLSEHEFEAARRQRQIEIGRRELLAARQKPDGPELARLVKRLPAELHAEALAAGQSLPDEVERIRTLMVMAGFLSGALQAEAVHHSLTTAQSLEPENRRAVAVQTLMRNLPTSSLPRELLEAVVRAASATVREFADAKRRDQALIQLGQASARLPADLQAIMREAALATARDLSGDATRAYELLGLIATDSLPEGASKADLIREALATVLKINNARERTQEISALAQRLPDDLKLEVLNAAREIPDARTRAEVLGHLPRYWSDSFQEMREIAWREALALAQTLPKKIDRAETLSRIAMHMPEAKQTELVTWAQQLTDDEERAMMLGGLAPRLPEASAIPLMQAALKAARQVRDPQARATVNAGLGVNLLLVLKGDVKTLLKGEAGKRARETAARALGIFTVEGDVLIGMRAYVRERLTEPQARAAALSVLAFQFMWKGRAKLLEEALAAARQVSDDWARAKTLSALARYLPDGLKAEAWREAQTAVREMELRPLLKHIQTELLDTEFVEVIVGAMDLLESGDAQAQAHGRAFVPVILDLVGQWSGTTQLNAVRQAAAAAQSIPDPALRARALTGLTKHFPKPMRRLSDVQKDVGRITEDG